MTRPSIRHNDFELTLPMPLFLVVEDVGWWQGRDGSHLGEPYRTGIGRRHCLADYEALAYMARRLSMRIQLAMVLCEWDRTDFLKGISGATWMGTHWNNRVNRGPELEETADFLKRNSRWLEIGLHGIGHEFWVDGRMERSEFHNRDGIMRAPQVVRQHLDGFGKLLEQHRLGPFPGAFVPPALCHSFGNGDESFQAILRGFGIRYVSTVFSRARQFSAPRHPRLTWECGVLLVERNEAAVPWRLVAAPPVRSTLGPVVSLHWANLLHPDPRRNLEVVAPWVDRLVAADSDPDRFLAPDTASCWSQHACCCLATLRPHGPGVEIDLGRLPDLDGIPSPLYVKIRERERRRWLATGGEIDSCRAQGSDTTLLGITPRKGTRRLYLRPCSESASR